MILKYTGYYSFQFPISNDPYEQSQSSRIHPNVSTLKGLILSIENAMRLVFTNVVKDEVCEEDFQSDEETDEIPEDTFNLHESLQLALQKSKSYHRKKHIVESLKSTIGSSINTNLTNLSKIEN
jgi:hypothetical protein